jgi:hypothetical protein
MLLERNASAEAVQYRFDNVTAAILRMHDIEFLGSEMIGAPNDPDASDLFLRVNDAHVKLRLERAQDGKPAIRPMISPFMTFSVSERVRHEGVDQR